MICTILDGVIALVLVIPIVGDGEFHMVTLTIIILMDIMVGTTGTLLIIAITMAIGMAIIPDIMDIIRIITIIIIIHTMGQGLGDRSLLASYIILA